MSTFITDSITSAIRPGTITTGTTITGSSTITGESITSTPTYSNPMHYITYVEPSINEEIEYIIKINSSILKEMLDPIEKVIFNDPATIVYWKDGSKTIVKCQWGDNYDKEKGLALCFMKKFLGNKGNFNDMFRKYIGEEDY